jgi:hypothetical protein
MIEGRLSRRSRTADIGLGGPRRAVVVAVVLTAVGGTLLHLLWPGPPPGERPIRHLALIGPAARADAEISGLAWAGDRLILLPQYPGPPRTDAPSLFQVTREALTVSRTDDRPVVPEPLPCDFVGDLGPAFDGFEAIAVDGDALYLTAELEDDGHGVVGVLLRGRLEGDRAVVELDRHLALRAQTGLANIGYEALVLVPDGVLVLYEVNGEPNPTPRALLADRGLTTLREVPLDGLEYRLTDATAADGEGRFWVANYHWPGSGWSPGVCELTRSYGRGQSHARCRTVERLVEMRWTGDAVRLTGRAPLLLELVDDAHARNWEGVARDGDGFVLVTDRYPETIFAYVE